MTDGGNGLEEALRRLGRGRDDRPGRYPAAERLCDFAKVWQAGEDAARVAWGREVKGLLDERGGEAVLAHLHTLGDFGSPTPRTA